MALRAALALLCMRASSCTDCKATTIWFTNKAFMSGKTIALRAQKPSQIPPVNTIFIGL